MNKTKLPIRKRLENVPQFSGSVDAVVTEMYGYFKGEKGLRQGDPLSPYLFTLVMQMFSLMIKRRIEEEGNFKYHPKCAKFNITHLSFADDLFLFCAANPTSVQILKDCLDEFGRCSGLWPNNVTKQVEKLIRGFIWGGKDSSRGKAKVAWKDVCCPKQEGGLALRSLRCWNKALMTFHIWNIVSDSSSLWVKWIHGYRIRRRNFWDITEAWDAPWSWKNILVLRTEVRPFIKTHVGNGQKTNFWYDTWALDIPFSSICSHRDISGMSLNKYNTVADFGMDGQVVWLWELVHKIPDLQGLFVRLSNSLDQVKWIS
ncbi:hypothetical protein AgCh_017084 [Apium graveolens]